MERPGIVDLRDLSHRYMWDERAIAPFIAAIGLHVAPQAAWRGFAPPRVLVLIAAHDDARLLERSLDVAAFVRDPRRVALYAQTAEFRERATDDLLEEDNRELAPVVVLGPSPALRYAVDLRHRVVRVRSTRERELAEIVGGPDEGFAVLDVDHRIVRRGTGILLGGWFRFATVEDGGSLWREDLATSERTLLGSAARVACVEPEVDAILLDAIRDGRHDAVAELRANHATRAITGDLEVVAITGTRNIIEIAPDFLRVV